MSAPPPYKPHPDSPEQEPNSEHPTRRIADEEYGFWGEEPRDPSEDENALPFRLRDILYAVVYTVVILVLVLNVDAVMSRLGFGSGKGILDGKKAVVMGGGHMAEIYFCGETTANVGSTWRVVSANELGGCEGKVVMLLARPVDDEILRTGDKLSFGAVDGGVGGVENGGEKGKFLEEQKTEAGEKEAVVIPDDLAEEGMLRFPAGNHMHAGFGGPWRGRSRRG